MVLQSLEEVCASCRQVGLARGPRNRRESGSVSAGDFESVERPQLRQLSPVASIDVLRKRGLDVLQKLFNDRSVALHN